MKNEFIYRFTRNKVAVAAAMVLLLIIFVAIFADVIFDYQTDIIGQNVSERLQPPSFKHLLGTDDFGRDTFSRVVYGARYSLLISVSTVCMSTLFGLIIGSVAGYCGGKIDNIIMRVLDVFLSIPQILLAIAIVAATGPGIRNLVFAFVVTTTPGMSRLVRISVLSIKEQEYIEAAKAVATSRLRIVAEHIWPNIIGPIIVQASLSIGGIILTTSSLSFMGLGVTPPTPEWGAMLSNAKRFMLSHPQIIMYPGLAIIITVLSINLVGDGIRDAIDPRLRD